jgi:aldehyde dehydrogenase (NAD+)
VRQSGDPIEETDMDAFSTLGIERTNPGTFAGCWQAGSEQIVQVENPARGSSLAQVHCGGSSAADAVIETATQHAAQWRLVPAPRRAELVRRIAALLRDKREALATLLSAENGKFLSEADGEVQEMLDIADFAIGQARMLYGRTMPSERPAHRMYEQWHPLGPIAVITAFNFPVAVWAWNAFLAAVCGDTVIWKPSPKTPLSAIAVQRLCEQAMHELEMPGVFSLFVCADQAPIERMVDDARLPLVSFTGSTEVGRHVAQRIAARLGCSLLELGGNNAVIVDASADLDLAIPAIVFGAVGTAGQRCTTTRRVIVHESLRAELIERLRSAYARVTIGDPLDPQTLMGPLIDAAAVSGYRAALDRVRAEGGEIVHGGNLLNGPGYFVEPTLVTAHPGMSVIRRETFAPILYLLSFRTPEEAIALQNAVPQGLSSSLFTRDLNRAEQFLGAAGSDCGIANVNVGTSGAEIGGAFGGEKQTGGGREAGSDSWKAYMRRQTVTVNAGSRLELSQGVRFDSGG